MSVVYKWKSLAEVAAYFEHLARVERESISDAISKRRNSDHRLIAATFENVADVLRNTVLTKDAPEGGHKEAILFTAPESPAGDSQ